MPDGPLATLFGHGAQQEAVQQQAKHAQVSELSSLLDRPDITLDAKQAIATHLEDLMNVNAKSKGLMPLITSIFHTNQQQHIQHVTDNLFGDLNTTVQGPDTTGETLDSRVARLKAGVSANADTSQGLTPTPAPDPVSGVLHQYVRRGDLTGNDITLANHLRTLGVQSQYENQKQQEMETRQNANIKARGDEVMKQVTQRGKDAMDRVKARGEIQGDLLDQKAVNAAHADYNKYIVAGYTPDQAEQMLQQDAQVKRDAQTTKAAWYAAQTQAIPERTAQAWKRLDETSIRNELTRTQIGNAAQKARFDERVKGPMEDLKSARRQIEYFSKFDLSDPKNATAAQKLQEAKTLESGALNELYKAKGEFSPETPQTTVPQRSGRSSKYVAPKVSTDRLKQLMAP